MADAEEGRQEVERPGMEVNLDDERKYVPWDVACQPMCEVCF